MDGFNSPWPNPFLRSSNSDAESFLREALWADASGPAAAVRGKPVVVSSPSGGLCNPEWSNGGGEKGKHLTSQKVGSPPLAGLVPEWSEL